MRKMLFMLPAAAILFFACSNRQKIENRQERFEISSGVNISHWLSQVYGLSQRDVFFTKDDVRIIDSLGFDHIRLPIDEKEMWDEAGAPIPESFQYMRNAIEWCLEYNLRVIVDLHIIRSFYFNAANNEGMENTLFNDPAEQQHFYSLWRQLSDSLKNFPNSMVAYELLNEAVAENPEDWNNLIAGGVAAVREQEQERIIFVGSNNWQMASTFPVLKVPEADTNIVLSMHNYDPMLFTHYKANWTSFKAFEGDVSYPGPIISEETAKKYAGIAPDYVLKDALKHYGPQTFEHIFKPALDKSKELGLSLYCGEFGALPTVERNDRLQYYRDIISVFRKHNISYTVWDYKGLFGIRGWDPEANSNTFLDTELANILVNGR
jgi:endoglucanase